MKIRDLANLKQFFEESVKSPIFGVGVYAFDRLGLEDIIQTYRILALRYSCDTQLLEGDLTVLSLEKGLGTRHMKEPRNSTTVLKHLKTREYLLNFDRPALIVYKTSLKMERICRENNWQLIGAPIQFGKKLLEDKVKFRKILKTVGVAPAPGEIVLVENIDSNQDFLKFKTLYGLPFVLQHPRRGGGKGTFFIHSEEDWQMAIGKLRIREKEGEMIREDIRGLQIIIAKYIHGPSPSITGCVTRHGILSTSPQYQLIDIPELYSPKKGSGLFCGHDWSSSRFSETIEKQAYEIVEKVGNYFKKIGYKGIFGIDFVLDEAEQRLFVTECNPRLLGSFPVITMAQIRNNEPPILGFHILEYLDVDYEIDVEQINGLMRRPKEGAQMFSHNLTGSWAKNNNEVRVGVYRLKMPDAPHQLSSALLEFVRPGYALKHLHFKDEFLLTDGVLEGHSHFSPNRRLCRIITLNKVLDENKKKLTPWARQVAATVHSAFDLKKIRFAKLIKFFNPNFLAKG